MLYNPELAFYVLFFPVFISLVFPLTITLTKFLFRLPVLGTAYFKGNNHVYSPKRDVENGSIWEKRSNPRYNVSEILVDVTDGTNSCTTLACNISKFGISLLDIPEKIMEEVDKLSIIVRKQGGHYPMYLSPQWVNKTDSSINIGGSLENVPRDWENIVTANVATS